MGLEVASADVTFTKEEMERYSRHLIMPEVTIDGQKKLKAASILCIGTGGLGSPLSMYLAAAGVGRIGLVDFDVVDHSNLQRQLVHGTKDVGKSKLESAVETLRDINPHVQYDLHNTMLNSRNALEIMEPYDIIIDGTDNFPTRYLVNDACVLLGKPNVYGSIFRFDGQASVFWAEEGPCYRCLYPEPPPPGLVPSCAEGGVLGILPGIIGVMQATEAIKLIIGIGKPLIGRRLLFDALEMSFKEFKVRKDPNCPVCSEDPTVTELIDYQQFCGIPQQEEVEKQEAAAVEVAEMTALEFKARLDAGDAPFLLDVRETYEHRMCAIPSETLVVPLAEVTRRKEEFADKDEIVVYCRTGRRSGDAIRRLVEQGVSAKMYNLVGGIHAWADDVDSSIPKY
jgi:adenylyltransferase/sulfurtransferase